MLAKNKALPDMCFSINEDAPPGKYVVAIKNGETGYFSTTYDTTDLKTARAIVSRMNEKLGVSPIQLECMENGSMFGWGTPGANPSWVSESIKKREAEQCSNPH